MKDGSPDKLMAQLERILASSEFSGRKQLSQFLRYVVEQTLSGQSNRIKQYTVGVEALGYGSDFDPHTNPTVRIEARRLRRALDMYYYGQGIGDPIRIDMPKGGYIPVFTENHTALQASDLSNCPAPAVTSPQHGTPKPAIAVIMFDCLNTKNEFDFLATGLTEEIMIALTRFPDFIVIGPLSRDLIQQKLLDERAIGTKYGVRFVLDGTIRVQGEMFRLTVRLTDASSGRQLWGNVEDGKLRANTIVAFEESLVGQVVATIADSYGIVPRTLTNEALVRKTGSMDAYEAILLYYHYFRVFSDKSFAEAMTALEKALAVHPENALATAALSDLVASAYMFGYDDAESTLARAEVLARKATALDPNCQVARWSMAFIYFLNFERSLFLNEAEHALRLNPNNAHFVAVLALHFAMVGEGDRAAKLIEKAMRLNPHHPGWYHMIDFMICYRRGDYNRALIEARLFNSPDIFWDPLIRAAVLGQLDRRVDARKAVGELLALIPDFKRRGADLIRRLTYLDEHVDMLLEGLRKAGLETQHEAANSN